MVANDMSEQVSERVRSYQENGYLVLEGIFSHDECDRLLTIFEEHANPPDMAAILNLDRTEPDVRAVMTDRQVVGPVETLQKAPVVGLMSQVLFKAAGTRYASQAWQPHQDNSYAQAKPGAYITTNIFLADAGPENGGLFLYPGSHLEGLLPFHPAVSYRETRNHPGNRVEVPEDWKSLDLHVKKGDLLVLHGCVVHGSYPNLSERDRPLFQVTYIKRGYDFVSGKNANRQVIEL